MSGVFEQQPDVTASGDDSVAAGRDIGAVVNGPGAVGTQHIKEATFQVAPSYPDNAPRAASVEAPPGLANLPVRPRLFVGRERELALLDAALAAPGNTVVHALHGLGGVGKSTLAAHWVAERAQHSPVWWIAGDTPAAVDAGLAALAAAVEPALTSFMQQRQLRDWALQWLAAHRNWLLILDNVADPADVRGLLAAAHGGRFLLTSRRATGWHGIAETVSLDVLTQDEAIDLFTRICPGAGDGVGAVCAELGCLPLAVEQAAAYCLETGTTAAEYRTLLADYPADMYTAATEGGDMERTVARVWRVTLERLADDPLAVTILLTLAWYAPEDIPRSLLDTLGPPPAVRRAVGRLVAHSMVTLRGTSSLSLHRLVQAVARTPDHNDPHRTPAAVARARDIAAECLVEAVPADGEDPVQWPDWRALLPHVEAMAEYAPQDADSVDLARTFSRMGEFVGRQGMTSRATRLLRRGASGLVRILGPEHLLSLVARNRLMNQKTESVEDTLAHIAVCERVLGQRHPETLSARLELAGAHLKERQYEQGARVLEHVVKVRGRVLGPGHPDTLRARRSFLVLRLMTSDAEAVPQDWERLHADCVRELGEKHPLTLDVRGMRSQVSGLGGRFVGLSAMVSGIRAGDTEDEQRAAQIEVAVQRIREEISPEEVRAWASESLQDAESHLADCAAVLGPEHNETITARLNLAQAYMYLEDFDQAAPLAEQAAEDAERHLGADDLTTFQARFCLLLLSLMSGNVAMGDAAFDWFNAVAERTEGPERTAVVNLVNAIGPMRGILGQARDLSLGPMSALREAVNVDGLMEMLDTNGFIADMDTKVLRAALRSQGSTALDTESIAELLDVEALVKSVDVKERAKSIDVEELVKLLDVEDLAAGWNDEEPDLEGLVAALEAKGITGPVDLRRLVAAMEAEGVLEALEAGEPTPPTDTQPD
jgi:hypothetical protein